MFNTELALFEKKGGGSMGSRGADEFLRRVRGFKDDRMFDLIMNLSDRSK
jgi:hypothetical protein